MMLAPGAKREPLRDGERLKVCARCRLEGVVSVELARTDFFLRESRADGSRGGTYVCRSCRARDQRRRRRAHGGGYLASGPLLAWLERRVALGVSRETLCARLGIASRSMRAWQSGQAQHVRVGVVERILAADDNGTTITDLYPDVWALLDET